MERTEMARHIEAPYIERDCTFTHEGRTFESGGAVVTDEYAIGYVKDLREATIGAPRQQYGRITDWHGTTTLGYVTAQRSWSVRSYVTDRMYQLTVCIGGVYFTGRSGGEGMIWKGRRVARQ